MKNSKNIDFSYDFFDKYSEKVFDGINRPETLLDMLRLYTKCELNIIRKELGISGLSNLSKEKLVVALEKNIEKDLSHILKKFTEGEISFIKDLVKNNGILHLKEEFTNELHYLRRFGIVDFFEGSSGKKYIYMPNDIIPYINELLIDINVLTSVKQNERINRLLKGLLFYYGIMDSSQVLEFINQYLKEPMDIININNILFNNINKTNEICLKN